MHYPWEPNVLPGIATLRLDLIRPPPHGGGPDQIELWREEPGSLPRPLAVAPGEGVLGVPGIERFAVIDEHARELRIERAHGFDWDELKPGAVEAVAIVLGRTEKPEMDHDSDRLEPPRAATEKLEAAFPKPVLAAIRVVLAADRLAEATRAALSEWDDPGAFARLRRALTAYDEAKAAALAPHVLPIGDRPAAGLLRESRT